VTPTLQPKTAVSAPHVLKRETFQTSRRARLPDTRVSLSFGFASVGVTFTATMKAARC
jgi:hypothetical protein